MPLALGTWSVNVNGREGQLVIQTVDAQGVVAGTLFGNPIRGLWSEASQSVVFSLQFVFDISPVFVYAYKGWLFSTPPIAEPGRDILWSLTGFVLDPTGQSDQGINGTSRRNEFGWFAQFREVM